MLGNAKGAVAVVISILLFRNPVTIVGMGGYTITVMGVAAYGETKRRFRWTWQSIHHIVLFVYFIVVIYDMNKIPCNVCRSRRKWFYTNMLLYLPHKYLSITRTFYPNSTSHFLCWHRAHNKFSIWKCTFLIGNLLLFEKKKK